MGLRKLRDYNGGRLHRACGRKGARVPRSGLGEEQNAVAAQNPRFHHITPAEMALEPLGNPSIAADYPYPS